MNGQRFIIWGSIEKEFEGGRLQVYSKMYKDIGICKVMHIINEGNKDQRFK